MPCFCNDLFLNNARKYGGQEGGGGGRQFKASNWSVVILESKSNKPTDLIMVSSLSAFSPRLGKRSCINLMLSNGRLKYLRSPRP